MTITIASEALLAAARTQRVLASDELQNLRTLLTDQLLHTPDEVRAWLPMSCLTPERVAKLSNLLPPRGRDFTPYRTLAHLATGGMGAIWLAASPAEHLVVVKTLIEGPTDDGMVATDHDGDVWIVDPVDPRPERPGSDALQRLERETRITRSLNHPHVVRCLDQGLTSDGQMFLVLEHMASGDLLELLTNHGQLTEILALSLARQVCTALAVAHNNHLLHRDVKPGNIFLAADGHAKLADFGFARSNQVNRTQLTLAGSILGSPLYMAPEQVTAHVALDIRCDLYGLGCVLFHCLTGAPPYRGSMHAVMRAHCTAAIPDITRIRADLLPETVTLINRLLQKSPADRPPHPLAVESALRVAMAKRGVDPALLVPLPSGCRSGTLSKPKSPTPALVGHSPISTKPPAVITRAPLAEDPLKSDLGDCLELTSACGLQIFCVARSVVIFGKLRGPHVDVCLRNYPADLHQETCNAVSRKHFSLHLTDQKVTLEDLGSANGTRLNGDVLTAHHAHVVSTHQPQHLSIAQTIQLNLTVWMHDHQVSSVTLTRPENQQKLMYAVVQQHLTLGPPGSDLVLPGAHDRHQLGRLDNRWVQRKKTEEAWQPLHSEDTFTCGNLRVTVRPGSADTL